MSELTWGRKNPKPLYEMATDHLLNALSQIDERRLELTRELAEINTKAMAITHIIESRTKRKEQTND